MASSLLLTAAIVVATASALLFSPAASQSCKSQTFSSSNATFANCEDLPTLKASLHWTYNSSARPDPTLSVAFVAAPAKPEGWIAWALNPTLTGMVGSQALIAFKDTNGSIVVKTYNISAYSAVTESPISYGVLNKRAEASGGTMRIFATLALPRAAGSGVNQVWQVGASVRNGVPMKHDFLPENLKSTATLQLSGTVARDKNGQAPSPSPVPESGNGGGSPTRSQRGNDTGGSWRVRGGAVGVHGVLVLLGVLLGF